MKHMNLLGSDITPRRDLNGMYLFLALFTVTPLLVVGALWGQTIIGGWAALVAVVIVHFIVTTIVFFVCFRVLAETPDGAADATA